MRPTVRATPPGFHARTTPSYLERLHLDPLLCVLLLGLALIGLFVLYSASSASGGTVERQAIRLLVAFVILLVFAQIPPERYYQWAPWLFGAGVLLLVAVLAVGQVSQGARRWLDIGPISIQPSELMKLAMPMMVARYLSLREFPPSWMAIGMTVLLIAIPCALTAKQPDLGTALLIASAGFAALFLAGLSLWILGLGLIGIASLMPILWHFLHQYQRDRVLTLLNPERDPLGKGYHIIQSKIAMGSGGLTGKGWMHGTQSHLDFLPAHTTDFIFAVIGEEFGFIGCTLVIVLFLVTLARGLWISTHTSTPFSRLLVGSLSLTFFISAFINMGMVIGILPVVGVPLPFISYGGSSMLTMAASFGIIMSVHTHRKLWSR